nr:exo-alpha-sialidase [Ignavibacteriaceae bacterium]
MEKLFFGLLLLLIINPIYTQTTIKNSPFPIDDVNHLNGEIVDFGNNEMYALWSRFEGSDRVRFYMSKSTDSGNTWQDQVVVFDTITSPSDIEEDLYAGTRLIKGDNNRLLLFIKAGKNKHTIYKYSDDGGASWTPNMRFILTNTFQSPSLRIISVVHLGAGKLILTGSNGTTLAGTKRSTDNGTTWQNWLSLPSPVFLNPALLSIGNGSFYLAGQQQGTSTPHKIYFVKYLSTNTWQDTVLVHEDTSVILSNPRLFRSSGNELYIYYTKTSKVFNRYNNSNIYYSKSSDEGTTWEIPVRVTYYPGVDDNLNLNSQSQKPYIVFSGDRNTLQGLKYLSWANGIELEDNSTPPVIYDHKLNKDSVVEGDSLKITVFTGSVSPITGVHLSGLLNDQPYTLQLFDDGNHNDSLPGDKIYGNFIRVFQEGDLLRFTISLQNSFGTTTTKEIITACAFPDLVKSMDIRTGRIILPFDYNGNLADVATASGGGMRYDSIVSIFSQGFMLSGMIESSVWAAGGFTASRILDFQAGEVGYPTNDPRNGIYKVALSDSAFGASWQKWKGAVSLGARYWDGNNNNVYDPIDLNQNGTWELN